MNLTGFFDGVEQAASESIKMEQGDYEVDGLLYCHKCNTPKQTRVFIFGENRTPPCLCKCASEKREREEAERARVEFERRVRENKRICFPEGEEKMHCWTFENADGSNEQIMQAMRKFVDNFAEFKSNGKGLLLFGTVGTGKTYAAACVANALLDKGYPVLLTTFARIANTVQGLFDGKQNYYDSLNKFPLLILDDLAAERKKSEYMQEIVYSVINARYNAGLPLIVTTNLTSEELKNPADMANIRTYSRLLEMCLPVKVEGNDKRREKLKNDFKQYSDMLGLRGVQ